MQIGPHKVPIVVGIKEVDTGNLGQCTTDPLPEIRLARLSSQWDYTTLLHESIHLISEFHDLGLPEAHVRTLDQALTLLLQTNPKFLVGLLQDQ
jgi:hypothetical protein